MVIDACFDRSQTKAVSFESLQNIGERKFILEYVAITATWRPPCGGTVSRPSR
jgi:hypothetical protein